MSEPNHKYAKRIAKAIVDNAIMFGMPVPKVESMYEYAKKGAGDVVSKKSYVNDLARTTAYFLQMGNFYKARTAWHDS